MSDEGDSEGSNGSVSGEGVVEEKLVGSAWKLTINSNQYEHQGNYPIYEALIRRLCLSSLILGFMEISDHSPKSEKCNWHVPVPGEMAPLVDKLEITCANEIGDNNHRLHSHITIHCFHYKYFRINYIGIRHWFCQQSRGFINPNVSGRNILLGGVGNRRYQNKTFGGRRKFRTVSEVREIGGKELFYDSATSGAGTF